MDKHNVEISKTLSWLLRHNLHKTTLKVEEDGYVKLDDVLKLPKFKNVTVEQVTHIVNENDKQRFSLIERYHELYIRANQGHSTETGKLIKQSELLTEITESLPCTENAEVTTLPECIHGTTLKAWALIKDSGLNRMNRTHIHFASGQHAISGFRKSSEVLIYVNMKLAMADGIKFYLSDNGVILTEGVDGILDPKYFSLVVQVML